MTAIIFIATWYGSSRRLNLSFFSSLRDAIRSLTVLTSN